jgi:ACT domain-containing protein
MPGGDSVFLGRLFPAALCGRLICLRRIPLNAIITVVGSDKVGIIAKVSATLAEKNINIIDISQTILSGNFVMMMMVDLAAAKSPLAEVKKDLGAIGESMGVTINMMHERVFSAMHRI